MTIFFKRFNVASAAFAVIASLCTTALFAAPTKYPGLNYVFPLCVQRATKTQVTVHTNGDMKTAYKVLLEGTGITAKVLPREKQTPAGVSLIEIEVAADAPVGPRELRIATREAISTPGIIQITSLPVTQAIERGDDATKGQPLTFPGVFCGRLEKDVDEDWFRFDAKAGEQLNFAVLGARAHETMHKIGRFVPHFDATLVVTDATGREVASADDFYLADPLLCWKAPKAGAYRLRISEATYKGSDFYTYAIYCTKGPFATRFSPTAIEPGKTVKGKLHGPGCVPPIDAEVTMPADATPGAIVWLPPKAQGGDFLEVPILAAPAPMANHLLQLPVVIEGTVERGKTDWLTFTAASNRRQFRFEVFARRLFSPLDSELVVENAKKVKMVEFDDARTFAGVSTKDSIALWQAPAVGEYRLLIRDKLGRGGSDYAYAMVVQAVEADFQLTCDPMHSMIGPGSRSPIFVKAERRGGMADEPIALKVHGLPKGVSASAATIHPKMQEACIVLEAAEDAPIDTANIWIEGTATAKQDGKIRTLTRRAVPLVEIYQAQRRPGRTLAVAVTEPSDIKVESPVREIVLRPGETKEIPVIIKRAAKYKDGAVTLWADWQFTGRVFGSALPPGVTLDQRKSKLALNGSDVEGKIALTAAKDAKKITGVSTTILGQVAIEFSVFVPYCTAPIAISITE